VSGGLLACLLSFFLFAMRLTNPTPDRHEYGHDKGLSVFQQHACLDPSVPPFTSRVDLAIWLLRGSPKLCWLVDYVNKKKLEGHRVAIFVQWPTCQWLIEATFELFGFDYVSVRSEKTMKLRQEAVARFCDRTKRVDACVASYATASLGLNYQKGTQFMVHVEQPYNMSTYLQANGRLHRLGQKHVQEIIMLCMDASYDRTMLARIAAKYHPEMIATLKIPEDASIGHRVRPSADHPGERRNFDEEYAHLAIADMMGLRAPERNLNPRCPDRRQTRADVPATSATPGMCFLLPLPPPAPFPLDLDDHPNVSVVACFY
jgi:hypothetical protein